MEGDPLGIKLNLLAPGAATGMTHSTADAETIKRMQQTMAPAMVAPVAAWLVHEACTTVGWTYFAAGGKAAQMQLGQTRGVDIGDDRDLSRTSVAMTEAGITEGFVAEDSVATSLARR